MRTAPRFYDPQRPHGKPPSARQKAARDRNWRIFKLRGLYYQVFELTGERREIAQAAIDAELRELGAETQWSRHHRISKGEE